MRRRSIAALLPLLLAALLPAGAAADPDKDESGKGKRDERDERDAKDTQERGERARAPQPAPPALRPAPRAPQPAAPTPRPAVPVTSVAGLPAPLGRERLVSDPAHLAGVDGSGAGPVLLDLEGAHPNSAYEVQYVPAAGPAGGAMLGRVRTDHAGRFLGTAPEPLPALAEAARRGLFVLRRVA